MTPVEWAYLIIMLVGVAYTVTHQPKTPTPVALTIESVKTPVAEVGKEIPVVFGTKVVSDPNVVWYGDFRTSPVRVSSGK